MNNQNHRRKAVFVVGSGRSGTSTVAGILRRVGCHVPAPEVTTDQTNPKGFNEPQWMVDLHDGVLRRAGVSVADARPGAASDVELAASNAGTAAVAAAWLDEHFEVADQLVLKDPRLIWFLTPWRRAAATAGARASFITMLRPPPEVVGSKATYYGPQQEADGIAMWVNGMLHTELATRGAPRAFIHYEELLRNWRGTLGTSVRTLGIARGLRYDAAAADAVDAFVDPGLRRISVTWDDLSIPAYLRDVAERTWNHLSALTTPETDTPACYPAADDLRTDFARAYGQLDGASAYRRARRLVPRRALGLIPPQLRSRLGRATRHLIADRV